MDLNDVTKNWPGNHLWDDVAKGGKSPEVQNLGAMALANLKNRYMVEENLDAKSALHKAKNTVVTRELLDELLGTPSGGEKKA